MLSGRRVSTLEFIESIIKGAWIVQSNIHFDERGNFREWYKKSDLSREIGIEFSIAQANMSISSKGVLRGSHYSLAINGQAKWITCTRGKICDVIVDVRPRSQTYKKWVGAEISAESGKSVFIDGQLGHAFMALEDETVVTYLVDSEYSPNLELDVNPLDSEIGILWPDLQIVLSKKDALAPGLAIREKEGKLPNGF